MREKVWRERRTRASVSQTDAAVTRSRTADDAVPRGSPFPRALGARGAPAERARVLSAARAFSSRIPNKDAASGTSARAGAPSLPARASSFTPPSTRFANFREDRSRSRVVRRMRFRHASPHPCRRPCRRPSRRRRARPPRAFSPPRARRRRWRKVAARADVHERGVVRPRRRAGARGRLQRGRAQSERRASAELRRDDVRTAVRARARERAFRRRLEGEDVVAPDASSLAREHLLELARLGEAHRAPAQDHELGPRASRGGVRGHLAQDVRAQGSSPARSSARAFRSVASTRVSSATAWYPRSRQHTSARATRGGSRVDAHAQVDERHTARRGGDRGARGARRGLGAPRARRACSDCRGAVAFRFHEKAKSAALYLHGGVRSVDALGALGVARLSERNARGGRVRERGHVGRRLGLAVSRGRGRCGGGRDTRGAHPSAPPPGVTRCSA